MRNFFIFTAAFAVLFAGLSRPVNADDKDDLKKKREKMFGKSFGQKVEDAVDKGCDWLKTQQGIDKTAPDAVFGAKPNGPLYGAGQPHQYWIARTAFPLQALCKSGCFVDDPVIVKTIKWLRENYTENGAIGNLQGSVPSTTYEDATLLNAIEAYYISAWETHAAGLDNPRKRFKKVEDENGKKVKVPIKRWGTEEKGAKKKKKKRNFKLDRQDQKICELAVKALESRFRKAYGGGGWRYQKTGMAESAPQVDVSATQYAILGLKCASRLGIRYDKSILVDCFRFYRGQQDKDGPVVKANWKKSNTDDKKKKKHSTSSGDGEEKELHARGFAYCRNDLPPNEKEHGTAYGSMTAAGVNALILIRDELVDDPAQRHAWDTVEKECNQMIGDGLAWMIKNWTMKENPCAGRYRFYYYLYTVERLGMLGGIDEIGGHDWYYEGATGLLDDQKDNGMWDIGNEVNPSDLYNTCYALLFLKRASTGVDRPPPVITGDQ